MTTPLQETSFPIPGDSEIVSGLVEIERERRRLDQRYLEMVAAAEARGVAVSRGYRSTAALLVDLCHSARRVANRMVRLAGVVGREPAAAAALSDGAISVEHVEEIEDFRSSLSGAVHPGDWEGYVPILVGYSRAVPPARVRRLMETELRLRLDPDGVLPSEVELAEPENSLVLETRANGWVKIEALLEPEAGALLAAQLAPGSKPVSAEDTRTLRHRQRDSLAEWTRLGHAGIPMPTHGGERPQLLVTIPWETLASGLGYGTLGPQEVPISVSEARRLACDCSIIPLVLGADSAPLDIGKTSRTVPARMRQAVVHRDKHCAFPGCEKPAPHCEVHHVVEWQHGGETKTDNLTLLCGQHHRLIHHSDWQVHMRHGHPCFTPPAFLDPQRTPRDNRFRLRAAAG